MHSDSYPSSAQPLRTVFISPLCKYRQCDVTDAKKKVTGGKASAERDHGQDGARNVVVALGRNASERTLFLLDAHASCAYAPVTTQ